MTMRWAGMAGFFLQRADRFVHAILGGKHVLGVSFSPLTLGFGLESDGAHAWGFFLDLGIFLARGLYLLLWRHGLARFWFIIPSLQ